MELLTGPSLAQLDAADATADLVMAPEASLLPRLGTLLSRGCYLRIVTGSSVRELVLRQLGVSEAYLEREIKIVFLDGSPVDDLDQAIVRDGATVALSAAMPGLVGAAMRRDGLTWLRQSITHHETGAERPVAPGRLLLKLFNQVMEDLAPAVLRRGCYVGAPTLGAFLPNLDPTFWRGCGLRLNHQAVTPAALQAAVEAGQPPWLRLSVPRAPPLEERSPWI